MSEQVNDGGAAFPRSSQGVAGDVDVAKGMTLRDWFAGMALQGLLAGGSRLSDAPRWAYTAADAMISAREAKP